MSDPVTLSLPRGLYFQAEDHKHWHQDSPRLNERDLAVEVGRRHRAADAVKTWAHETNRAVDALRNFDRTGNIDQAIDHLAECAQRTLTCARLLIQGVEESSERWEQLEAKTLTAPQQAADVVPPAPAHSPAGAASIPSPAPAGPPSPASVFGGAR